MPHNKSHQFFFSIVTAAYNAAPWLDEMLLSLERQSFSFIENIQVILVDDGSTDETHAIATKWVQRYPHNIKIIHKENGGPASARNVGLNHVQGQWVGFIDADDMVASDYFAAVYNFLIESKYDGPLIACNTLLYEEESNAIINGHPLSYKFQNTRIVDLLTEPLNIQLFANACFFKSDLLLTSRCKFDHRIRPTFEDAHFLNIFLLHVGDFRIAFLKNAHYLYRRRGTGTGLVGSSWQSPAKYREQIMYGYLDLAQQYQKVMNEVPDFIQNMIVYESQWYIERFLDGGVSDVLDANSWDTFFDLMKLLFGHIDIKNILLSQLPMLGMKIRIAMLGVFKEAEFSSAPFFVSEIAPGGKEISVVHWSTCTDEIKNESHHINTPSYTISDSSGKKIYVQWSKEYIYHFANRTLLREYRCWIKLHPDFSIRIEVNGEQPGIICGSMLLNSLERSTVLQHFYLPITALNEHQQHIFKLAAGPAGNQYKGCWVFMDRVHKADDNAEHLCRWTMDNYPDLPVYFILDRRSGDWDRLQNENFPLLIHGSQEHFLALANAEWLISSHVDHAIIDPLDVRDRTGQPPYKMAFLQHGITKDDLSGWLNPKRIDLIVTSTQPEYESLLTGKYKFTQREVVLTGFPRHDALLHKSYSRKTARVALFCPTWRNYLPQPALTDTISPKESLNFRQSSFFQSWSNVTTSKSLCTLARNLGWRLLFLAHPRLEPLLSLFPQSEAFTFLKWSSLRSVQELIATCAIAITDYSSLAFEFAYLGRPVVYFQFPEVPDFFTGHTCKPGYFSYEKNGLGPVLRTQDKLEEWLGRTMQSGGKQEELYTSRAKDFFTLRDGQNCLRTYEAIAARSQH